jgi:hypothetical protein
VKLTVISAFLLFFVGLGFLGAQTLLLSTPAEFAETAAPEEKDEQSLKDPILRRGQTRGKKTQLSLIDLAAVIQSALNSYPGNLHLLQVFRV